MPIETIYSKELAPMYDETTDLYLQAIPAEADLGLVKELAEASALNREAKIAHMLFQNQDSLRQIEVSRRSIAWRASVFNQLVELHPNLVNQLPIELQTEVRDWASRIEGEATS